MISLHNDYVSLRADEHDGMTVVSLKFKGMETVLYDDERRKSGATYGIPILFPTPNRISGGEFTFNGKCIKGEMHGALRHAAFRITSQSETSVEGEVPFSALGETFPYDGRIKLSLHIEGTAVIWDFSVINEGDEPLAFGLALHPFFRKTAVMRFSSSLDYEMVSDDDKIPTGECLETDFGKEKDVQSIDTDTVFFSDSAIRSVLSSPDYSIEIAGSDEFNHVVVYTSPERPFVCVEPQTCSTDAHNLYSKGYEKESGLIIVPGNTVHELSVRMVFSGRV